MGNKKETSFSGTKYNATQQAAANKKYQDEQSAKKKQKAESDAASIANSTNGRPAKPLSGGDTHRNGSDQANELDKNQRVIITAGMPASPEVVEAAMGETKKKSKDYAEKD